MSTRKRFVYETRRIAHLWVHDHESQGQARNPQNNLYFVGRVIYSYRDSYPIGHIVERNGKTAVLIQENKYGNTTARHIGMVRQASRHLMQFIVPGLLDARCGNDPTVNLPWYRDEIAKAESSALKAHANKDWKTSRLVNLVNEANQYSEFFGLPDRFEQRSDAEVKEAIKRTREQQKRQQAQKILDAQKDIEKWKNGEPYSYVPSEINEAYLRIVDNQVETSKGARVPIEHAIKAIRFIRSVRAHGESYKRNGHTIHIGHYAIDEIDTKGNLRAGCHFIRYNEIERIAGQLDNLILTETEA